MEFLEKLALENYNENPAIIFKEILNKKMHPLIKATTKLSGHGLIFVTEKYKRAKSLVLSRDRSKYFLFGGPIFDSENSENRHCRVLKS